MRIILLYITIYRTCESVVVCKTFETPLTAENCEWIAEWNASIQDCIWNPSAFILRLLVTACPCFIFCVCVRVCLNAFIVAPRSSSPPVKLYKHRIDVTEGSGTSYGELPADVAMSYKPIAPAPTGSNHTPPGSNITSLHRRGVKSLGSCEGRGLGALLCHVTQRLPAGMRMNASQLCVSWTVVTHLSALSLVSKNTSWACQQEHPLTRPLRTKSWSARVARGVEAVSPRILILMTTLIWFQHQAYLTAAQLQVFDSKIEKNRTRHSFLSLWDALTPLFYWLSQYEYLQYFHFSTYW